LRGLSFLPGWSVALAVGVLPWLEVAIGSALVMGLFAPYAARRSLALLLAFSLVAVVAMARGLDVPCSCLGAASQSPFSWRTVVRNVLLALLVLPLVIISRPSPLSADAIRVGAANRSVEDVLLLTSFPLSVVAVTYLIATVQRTLNRSAPR
jgi:uncharacterized membrane protein YphA (DoxX/SURF4 family)